MSAFLAIVILLGLAYLNSRITDLEQMIRGLGKPGSVAPLGAPVPTPNAASSGIAAHKSASLSSVAEARMQDAVLEMEEDLLPAEKFVDEEGRMTSVGRVFKEALEVAPSAPVLPSEPPAPPAVQKPSDARAFADADQEEKSARALLRVGIVAIFFGVSYFFKFAFESGWIGPVFLEFMGVAIGLAMAGGAQYLLTRAERYRHYAAWLAGGGVGLLYLTIFAGAVWWQEETGLSQPIAFAFMAAITAFSMTLAVLGHGRALAIVGVVGGFLTPIVLASGENHLVALSLYILILDLGVLGVAFFRKWDMLNWISLAGTTILLEGWTSAFYREGDGQLAMVLLFSTLFFVTFLLVTLSRCIVRRESATSGDALFAVLAVAIYFGKVYGLIEPSYEAALGFFALGLSALYVVLSLAAARFRPGDAMLGMVFPSISAVLFTVAISLQFDGHWVTFAWLTEAAALIALASLSEMRHLRVFGFGVLAMGFLSLIGDLVDLRSGNSDFTPIANVAFVMQVYAAAVLAFVGAIHWYDRARVPDWKQIVSALALLANLVFLFAITTEISLTYAKNIDVVRHATAVTFGAGGDPEAIASLKNERNTVVSVVWTLYAFLLIGIGFVKRIRFARVFGLVLFFVTAFKIFLDVLELSKLYRAISLVAFGILALAGSFLYVRYKDRLRSIIAED